MSLKKEKTMPFRDTNFLSYALEFVHQCLFVVFSAVGGFLSHVLHAIEHNEKISWTRVFVQSAAAGFVGLIVLMLCKAMHIPDEWNGVIVGIAGWLGADVTINLVRQAIGERFHVLSDTSTTTTTDKKPEDEGKK